MKQIKLFLFITIVGSVLSFSSVVKVQAQEVELFPVEATDELIRNVYNRPLWSITPFNPGYGLEVPHDQSTDGIFQFPELLLTGEVKIPVFLVDWSDFESRIVDYQKKTPEEISAFLNSPEGPSGYFNEVSGGQFQISFDVHPWIDGDTSTYLKNKDDYFHRHENGSYSGLGYREYNKDVLRSVIADLGIDLTQYDADQNKVLDGYVILYEGSHSTKPGANAPNNRYAFESEPDAPIILDKLSDLFDESDLNYQYALGQDILFYKYINLPEQGSYTKTDTWVHELGHLLLGYGDYYRQPTSLGIYALSAGIGEGWGVAYHPAAMEKLLFARWIDSYSINDSGTYTLASHHVRSGEPYIEGSPYIYKILINDDPNHFLTIENRNFLPRNPSQGNYFTGNKVESGLVIFEVNQNLTEVPFNEKIWRHLPARLADETITSDKGAFQAGDQFDYVFEDFSLTIDEITPPNEDVSFNITFGTNKPFPPVLEPIGDINIFRGDTLIFNVVATDVNEEVLTYSANPLPPGATFNTNSHLFEWTTGEDAQPGLYQVTFTVTDSSGLSDEETIVIALEATSILDIDGNGVVEIQKDWQLLRFHIEDIQMQYALFYVSGDCKRCSAAALEVYLQKYGEYFDIDGNGSIDLNTDAQLIFNYLEGLRGNDLVNRVPIDSNGSRVTPQEIENYIETLIQNEGVLIEAAVLDIDGNGVVELLTDAQLVWYYMLGIRGDNLVNGYVALDCKRCSASAIEEYIEAHLSEFDIDGNASTDANPDGYLILAYAWGQRGDALINATTIDQNGQRTTVEEIESYLQSLTEFNKPPTLDIDGNGVVELLTDAQLVWYYMLGIRGDNLVNGYVALDCKRCSASAIEEYIEAHLSEFDIDGNASTDPNPDGYLILAYSWGQRGDALINATPIDPNGQRTTVEDIESYLQSLSVSLNGPTLEPIHDMLLSANNTFTFTVSAVDQGGDSLTYSVDSLPVGATLDPNTGDFSWTPTMNQLGEYEVMFTVSDPSGLFAQDSAKMIVQVGGLIGHWKFDEGNQLIASDDSGLNNHGSLVNGPVWRPGQIGTALQFDGSNDSVEVPDSPTLTLTSEVTLSAWVKINKHNGGTSTLICKGSCSSFGVSNYQLQVSSNAISFNAYFRLTSRSVHYSTTLETGRWYYLVGTHDGEWSRLYVDGVEKVANKRYYRVGSDQPNGALHIGSANGGGDPNRDWDGMIDEVRIYDLALSLEEIQALYNAGQYASEHNVISQSVEMTPNNTAPSVNAGADQIITLLSSVNLNGIVSDDGLPNPTATLTTQWSKVSGPGTVIFGNANTVNTTASFSVDGTYVLRLTANDSVLSSNDDLTITVNPEPVVVPVNIAPSVSAGIDQTVNFPGAANLNGTVNDDGLPNPPAAVTTTWSQVSGAGTVTFGNANVVDTTASFSEAGNYILRLTAHDGEFSASDDVSIIVNAAQVGALIPQSQMSVVYASSAVAFSGNVLDGNTKSYWGASGSNPREMVLDLGGTHTVSGFKYLPYSWTKCTQYEVYVSMTNGNWGDAIAAGDWANNSTEKEVLFSPTTAKFLKVKYLNNYCYVAEHNVIGQSSGN